MQTIIGQSILLQFDDSLITLLFDSFCAFVAIITFSTVFPSTFLEFSDSHMNEKENLWCQIESRHFCKLKLFDKRKTTEKEIHLCKSESTYAHTRTHSLPVMCRVLCAAAASSFNIAAEVTVFQSEICWFSEQKRTLWMVKTQWIAFCTEN